MTNTKIEIVYTDEQGNQRVIAKNSHGSMGGIEGNMMTIRRGHPPWIVDFGSLEGIDWPILRAISFLCLKTACTKLPLDPDHAPGVAAANAYLSASKETTKEVKRVGGMDPGSAGNPYVSVVARKEPWADTSLPDDPGLFFSVGKGAWNDKTPMEVIAVLDECIEFLREKIGARNPRRIMFTAPDKIREILHRYVTAAGVETILQCMQRKYPMLNMHKPGDLVDVEAAFLTIENGNPVEGKPRTGHLILRGIV